MKNQLVALKIKIKNLADEARDIRREERKAWHNRPEKYRDIDLFFSLREHRTKDVRSEARSSLLAYAYLRGKKFSRAEKASTDPRKSPDWARVKSLVEKFGGLPGFKMAVTQNDIADWASGKEVVTA